MSENTSINSQNKVVVVGNTSTSSGGATAAARDASNEPSQIDTGIFEFEYDDNTRELSQNAAKLENLSNAQSSSVKYDLRSDIVLSGLEDEDLSLVNISLNVPNLEPDAKDWMRCASSWAPAKLGVNHSQDSWACYSSKLGNWEYFRDCAESQ
jgi:hypothetical protein